MNLPALADYLNTQFTALLAKLPTLSGGKSPVTDADALAKQEAIRALIAAGVSVDQGAAGDEAWVTKPEPSWTVTATSGANAAAAATKAAPGAGYRHVITGYVVVVRAADVGADALVQAKSGTTVLLTDGLGLGDLRGARVIGPPAPIYCAENEAASLAVGAAGAGAIAELTLTGYTEAV